MNSDLRDLYQEIILDHNRRPRNKGVVAEANHEAEGHNPLCGDQIKVTLLTENGLVIDIAFQGQGCAISTASASLMTEAVKGKTVEEATQIFREFQQMVTETGEAGDYSDLGDLEVFQGVREYPVRIKCATLPWHTLHAALVGEEKVSTE
ncbi:MAG TPA: SUF system NifU family Fe-S cluster assembly protein [Fimbriimonadaceae bacterium]|nr:SUF system NifU family Fe-S cluster assembly protein [Fimbriimonadaceae bacterium]